MCNPKKVFHLMLFLFKKNFDIGRNFCNYFRSQLGGFSKENNFSCFR